MIWNGGSLYTGYTEPLDKVKEVFDYYNEHGINLQLTCTNPALEEFDIFDRYCNAVLELFLRYPNNSVLVSSPYLERYIRNSYPEAKIDLSIVGNTNPKNINSDFNSLIDNYHIVVLPRKYNHDFDYLNSIDLEKRNKVELLCTDPCSIDCPRLFSHYMDFAKFALYETMDRSTHGCTEINRDDLSADVNIEYQIRYPEFKKYLNLGYNRFKISGRGGGKLNIIKNYTKFLVKPEYQLEVGFHLLARTIGKNGGR